MTSLEVKYDVVNKLFEKLVRNTAVKTIQEYTRFDCKR